MSISTIQRNFVVVSDQQPSSPFEGQLWRDTSVGVLKQWDGNSWQTVQTSPDNLTIVENSSGELTVDKLPRDVLLGDFEADLGAWYWGGDSSYTDSYTRSRDASYSDKGSYSAYWDIQRSSSTSGSANVTLTRDINLADYDEINFWYRYELQYEDYYTALEYYDGSNWNQIWKGPEPYNYNSESGTRNVTVDISSINGSKIRFNAQTSAGNESGYNTGWIDNVTAYGETKVYTNKVDGAGN